MKRIPFDVKLAPSICTTAIYVYFFFQIKLLKYVSQKLAGSNIAQKYPFLLNLRALNSNLKSVFTHHL